MCQFQKSICRMVDFCLHRFYGLEAYEKFAVLSYAGGFIKKAAQR